MERYLEKIKAHPAFEGITEDGDVLWLRKCMEAKVEMYKKGDTIFREGEEQRFARILIEGDVLLVTQEGTVEKIGPGGALFRGVPSGRHFHAPFSALADTDVTVFSMRVLRLGKLCSFRCAFHARMLENIEKYF